MSILWFYITVHCIVAGYGASRPVYFKIRSEYRDDFKFVLLNHYSGGSMVISIEQVRSDA